MIRALLAWLRPAPPPAFAEWLAAVNQLCPVAGRLEAARLMYEAGADPARAAIAFRSHDEFRRAMNPIESVE